MAAEVGRVEAYRAVARAIDAGDPAAAETAARQLLEPATSGLISALSAIERSSIEQFKNEEE
jgi:DNA-binding FadR family transcriptional regulator